MKENDSSTPATTIETEVKSMTKEEVRQIWNEQPVETKIVLARLSMGMSIPLIPKDFEFSYTRTLKSIEIDPEQSLPIHVVYQQLHQSGLIVEGEVIPATLGTKHIPDQKAVLGYFLKKEYRRQLSLLASKL